MKKILILVVVTIAVMACKKMDGGPNIGKDFTKLKKYVIYDAEKMKTNYGNDCPSRKKGRCVRKIGNDFVKAGDETVVEMGIYHNEIWVAVDDDFKDDDAFIVEQDWVIWDKEVLENLNLKEPVFVKAGKYRFYEDSYGRYAMMPFDRAKINERTVVFVEGEDWRAESFYDGFLGECSVLTGVVEQFASVGQLRLLLPYSNGELVLLLPFENNVSEGGDRLNDIVESGKFSVKDDTYVEGLDVKVAKGEYEIEKVPEGVRVTLGVIGI